MREAAEVAAAVIFPPPNVFGILENTPELAAAAKNAGALAIAHVDPISLGVLEAPGNYGADLAIGEGQSAGNYRRMPGRTTASSPRRRSTHGGSPAGSSVRRPI